MRGSILSHSGKRLNDAWLGLLVSVPHSRAEPEEEGRREKERKGEREMSS